MRLPAEIRLNILRQLLTCEQPLDATNVPCAFRFSPRPDRSRPEVNFSFCPAILATCQLLYSEAIAVLYDENTIAMEHVNDYLLNLCTPKYRREFFSVLGGLVILPRSGNSKRQDQTLQATKQVEYDHEEPFDLENNALSYMRGGQASYWANRDAYARKMLAIAASLPRFQKFHVKIVRAPPKGGDVYHKMDLLNLCRTLKPVLSNKDVTINFHDRPRLLALHKLHSSGAKIDRPSQDLDYFRWLKCRSIKWMGVQGDSIEQLSNFITRTTDTPDTYILWHKLIRGPKDLTSSALGDCLLWEHRESALIHESYSSYALRAQLEYQPLVDWISSTSDDDAQDVCKDFDKFRHAALTNDYVEFQRLRVLLLTRAQK